MADVEERCAYCNDLTEIWSAPDDQWNAATEADGGPDQGRGVILCAECYMDLFSRKVGRARFRITAELLPLAPCAPVGDR